MHEFGIAQRILDTALEEAKKHGVEKITRIRVNVGKLNNLTEDSLKFAFGIVTKDTIAAEAEIEMNESEGTAIQIVNFDAD